MGEKKKSHFLSFFPTQNTKSLQPTPKDIATRALLLEVRIFLPREWCIGTSHSPCAPLLIWLRFEWNECRGSVDSRQLWTWLTAHSRSSLLCALTTWGPRIFQLSCYVIAAAVSFTRQMPFSYLHLMGRREGENNYCQLLHGSGNRVRARPWRPGLEKHTSYCQQPL